MKLSEDISKAVNGPQNPRAWAEACWKWGAQPGKGREAMSDACFSDARGVASTPVSVKGTFVLTSRSLRHYPACSERSQLLPPELLA